MRQLAATIVIVLSLTTSAIAQERPHAYSFLQKGAPCLTS